MGRYGVDDRYFHFDSVSFLNDLRKAVKLASEEIKNLLYKDVTKSIDRLPFKTNAVPLAGGRKTSDHDRAERLIDSVEATVNQYLASSHVSNDLNWKSGHSDHQTVVPITVSAMGKYYKDSHIGWYYELGTGVYEEIPFSGYWGTEAENPVRTGFKSPIVSRPAGIWKDAGGNIRKSKGKGGVRNRTFIKFIGNDVKAHRWFQKSFTHNRREIINIYRKHIKTVDFREYVYFKKKIVLGKGRRGK